MDSRYEILDWDSAFFGYKVARMVNANAAYGIDSLVDNLRSEGVRVAYLTANPKDTSLNNAFLAAGAQLVDKKTTYTISTMGLTPFPSDAVEYYTGDANNKELLSIACQTGEYSRFRVDRNFGPEACDRLYKQWVRNDASGQSGSILYVCPIGSAIAGLITLKNLEQVGSIGLIGVSSQHRGQNIGMALMGKAISHFQELGIFRIDVVTQQANIPACRFYQKCGFEIKSVINYYHLWL